MRKLPSGSVGKVSGCGHRACETTARVGGARDVQPSWEARECKQVLEQSEKAELASS